MLRMDEILRHFDTMGSQHLLVFIRESSEPGFLRCRISSTVWPQKGLPSGLLLGCSGILAFPLASRLEAQTTSMHTETIKVPENKTWPQNWMAINTQVDEGVWVQHVNFRFDFDSFWGESEKWTGKVGGVNRCRFAVFRM